MNIGEKIKEARKKKGYTQKQLADILGLQDAAISKYEKNIVSPNVEMLKRIANALGIRLNHLLYDDIDLSYNINNMGEIGTRIKEYRLKADFTQKELAEKIDMTVEELNNYEHGISFPNNDISTKIADVLNIDVLYLILGETIVNPNKKLELLTEIASKLNDKGKDKVIDYATDLSEQEKYTKPDE